MRNKVIALGIFLALFSGTSAWAATGPYYSSVPAGCQVRPDGSQADAGPIYDARGFFVGYYRPAQPPQPPTIVYQTVYQTVAADPAPPECAPAPPASPVGRSGINWNWLLPGDPPGGYSGF